MDNKIINLLAINGSTRVKSSNQHLLNYLKDRYAKEVQLEIYNELDQLPHFNPDLDNNEVPAIITSLRSKIDRADVVLICTPEYVFSLPGSLKNLLEWQVSTTLLSNKPMGFIIAAASGEKAFESLNLILTTLEAKLIPSSKLLVKGIKGKINIEGQITDTQLINQLDELIGSLLALAKSTMQINS